MRTLYIYMVCAGMLALAAPVQASLYLPIPTQVAPSNGAVGLYGYAQLRWNYVPDYQQLYGQPAQTALNYFNRYQVQVATDSSFSNIIYDAVNLTDTTEYVFSLDYYTTYYWHVRVMDFVDTSGWSDTWRFRTIVGPPDLVSPLDDEMGVSITPTMRWFQELGATSYNLFIADDVESESYIYEAYGIVDTFTTIPPGILENSTQYYWFVEAVEPAGPGYWSYSWAFTTIAAPPELIAPDDGETALSLTPELLWHTSSYAQLYQVEVDDDPAFGSPEFQATLTDTTVQVPQGLLAEFTVYNWRVRLQESAGYSEWSAPWTFRTIVAPPLQLSPFDTQTGVAIDAALEWYPAPGASAYEVLVFRDAAMTDTLVSGYVANSTLYGLSGYLVHYSRYYWKVRALEPGGESAWSPLWSFRTIIPPPSLVAPSNLETGVPTQTAFEWTSSPNAKGYRIQVSESQIFSTLDVDDGPLTGTQYTLPNSLREFTVYYWHVAAIDPGGQESWSTTWQYRTIVPPPNLLLPANNATAVLVPVQMSWTTVSEADAYRLQCSTVPDFSSVLIDNSSVANANFLLYNIAGHETLYWRVASVENGRFSRWSNERAFRTLIGEPQLSAPVNDAKAVALAPTFEWVDLTGADSYDFQLAQNETFETTVENLSGITDLSVLIQGLTKSTQYCWRVRGVDDGVPGPWSEVFTFKTVLPGPSLVAPDSGAQDIPSMQQFAWNSVNGAHGYRMQIATDSAFSAIHFDKYEPGDTSITIDPLGYGELYYWRAQFIDRDGESDWSSPWAFATRIAPPNAPKLIVPSNGSAGEPITTVLEWSSVGSVTYHVQVATDAAFSSLVVDDSGLLQVTYGLGPLEYGTPYYWRVAAKDAQGLFEWSSTWTFTTVVAAPDLLFPPDGDMLSPAAVTMQWDPVLGAGSYQIQIAGDASFKNIAIDQSGVGQNNFLFSSPKQFTQYFWRVRATGLGSTGDWSTVWEFQTTTPGPTLVSPKNVAANVSIPTTFEWQQLDGTLYYGIQVSENISFSKIIVQADTITGDTFTTDQLDYRTTYYWRVHAWNGQIWSGWSGVWSFTTLDPPIATPVLLLPANNASGLDPAVNFRWEPATGADTYRIQVATNEAFTAIVIDEAGLSNTAYQAAGLSKGVIYYWRVRADASFGSSAWSNTWKFTTGGLVPILTAPANGATFVALPPTLQWRVLPGALNYRVQVSLTQGFVVTELDETVPETTTSLSATGLSNGKQYYWRVSAMDAAGPTDWSEVWTFSTPPNGPPLASPTNGAQQVSINVMLQWLPVTNAQSFTAQVAEDPAFATMTAQQSGIASTSWSPTGLETDKTYYWRVKTVFANGESGWSETWSFGTGKPAPILNAPSNTATDLAPTLDLEWQAYSGAQSYQLQLARDEGFTDIIEEQDNINGLSYPLTGLEGLTSYYWRVMAATPTGNTPWSEIWKFTTATQIVTLASPANSATGLPVPVTVQWITVVGAASYEVQVATDNLFGTIVASSSNESGTSFEVDGLAPSQAHYWRVRANFSFGTGPWSEVRVFTTEGGLPVLISPADLEVDVPLSPQFTWAAVNGAPGYDLQIATDAVFSVLFVDETGLPTTDYNWAVLDPLTTYFWRVRVSNGVWTAPWSFTTIPPLPDAPVLSSPVDGAGGVALSPTLTWQAATNAEEYRVEIAATSSMANPLIQDAGIAALQYDVQNLSPGQTYYWHVAGSNITGTGPYSEVWSFTTQTSGSLTMQYPSGTLGNGLTITGTIPAGFNVGTATLFYKPIGAPTYDSAAMNVAGTSLEGTIPGTAATIRGLAAWVRVVSSDGLQTLTDPVADPANAPEYIRVSFDRVAYPIPFILQQYSMVSVPAKLGNPTPSVQLIDDYGEYDTQFWRVLRWNGVSYDEFPGIGGLLNGGSWWMITQFGRGFDVEQGQSVDPRTEGKITLAPGWTQVGGPYAFNVEWASIPGVSGLIGPYEYDGLEYIPDRSVLEAWKGYFVLNESGSPVELTVPPVETALAPGKSRAMAGEASFLLTLSLRSQTGTWRDTYNQVGLTSVSASTLPEPPSIRTHPHLSVRDGNDAFMRIVSRQGSEGNTWIVGVDGASEDKTGALLIRAEGVLPQGWTYQVIDSRNGAVYDASVQETKLSLQSNGDLVVVAGTRDYLARVASMYEAVVTESGLGENYPNPFNPSTTIPFTLLAASDVVISVYDLQGRHVKTLTDAHFISGRHSVFWDGRDAAGEIVAAGTYVTRMTAGSAVWTKTLTMTK